MRKTLFTLSIGLLLSSTAGWAGDEPALRSTRGGRVAQLAAPAEIVILYKSLAALPFNEQRVQLRDISPAVKAQLWAYNVHRFLLEHRQLSQGQRDVLQDAIDLLTPELFEQVETGSLDYKSRQSALGLHKQAMKAVFTPDVIRVLALRLGPEPAPAPDSATVLLPGQTSIQAGAHAVKPAMGGNFCDCHDTEEDCFSPSAVCWGFPFCEPWLGCGIYGQEACDGTCQG